MTNLKLLGIKDTGPSDYEKLSSIGIRTSDNLLKKGRTQQGIKEISSQTQIPETIIQKWLNKINLHQIEGIGIGFSDLLENSAIYSVPELAKSNPETLLEKIIQVNNLKKIVRRTPPLHEVESWVHQAQIFPKSVKSPDEKRNYNAGIYGTSAKNNFEVEDNLKNYIHRVKQKHKNSYPKRTGQHLPNI